MFTELLYFCHKDSTLCYECIPSFEFCFLNVFILSHLSSISKSFDIYIFTGYVYLQIKNILAPGVADPHGTWHSCKLDIENCSPTQLQTMQGTSVTHSLTLLGCYILLH